MVHFYCFQSKYGKFIPQSTFSKHFFEIIFQCEIQKPENN